MIVEMCRMFSCTPSQLLAEDSSALRYYNLAKIGATAGGPQEAPYGQ